MNKCRERKHQKLFCTVNTQETKKTRKWKRKRWLAQKKHGHTQRQSLQVVALFFRPFSQVEQTICTSVWQRASTIFRVLTLMPLLEPLSRTRSVARARFHACSTFFNPKSKYYERCARQCRPSVSVCVYLSAFSRPCVDLYVPTAEQAFIRASAKDTPHDHVHNRHASRNVHAISGRSRNRTDRKRHLMDLGNACSTPKIWS